VDRVGNGLEVDKEGARLGVGTWIRSRFSLVY